MKIGHLRAVDFTLRIIGPVHIGDGGRLSGYEYLYDVRTGQISVLNDQHLIRYIADRRLMDSFEEFVTSGGQRNLRDWFRSNAVSLADQRRLIRYTVSVESGARLRPNDFRFFIKGADGLPYIPGSSLKGALRTALAAAFIEQGDSALLRQSVDISRSKFAAVNLESRLFRILNRHKEKPGDILNDVMCGLRVCDSPPLAHSDLIVAQKLDRSVRGETKYMPVMRESLRPGTRVPIRIVFDESILGGHQLDADCLLSALQSFSDHVQAHFDARFPSRREDAKCPQTGALLLLGGGSGYSGKTVTGRLYGKEALQRTSEILDRNFPRHNHRRDGELDVSPRFLPMTAWRGMTYRMGLCQLVREKEADRA